MSRFRIPGGIGYQGHYPLGSIEDGTLVRTNSNAPSSFQTSVASAWDDLSYEAKAKIASAGVDVNRLMSVVKAVNRSRAKVVPMLVAEVGVRVEELVAGVIPGLLIVLCCVVSTTALGAAAGGALGFLIGGVGAAPGAVLGGTLGFEAGIALLTWLGLAFLVSHVAKDLGIAIDKAIAGLQTAWDAGKQSGAAGDLRIDFAATQLASAVVHLFLSIVNALIAYITKGAATSSVKNMKGAVSEAALAEAIVKINKSKILGKTVGAWFQKNYQTIIEFRSRKTARPSDSPRPLEPAMTPAQIKKLKEESGHAPSKQTPEQLATLVASRKALARDFYVKAGMPEHKVDGHLAGIDFNKPVSVVDLKANTRLSQFQVPGAPQGTYYSAAADSASPSSLGIAAQSIDRATGLLTDKISTPYLTTGPTSALRTTAASILDTWSVPGKSIPTAGGATQFYIPPGASIRPGP